MDFQLLGEWRWFDFSTVKCTTLNYIGTGPWREPAQDEGQACSGLKAMLTNKRRVGFAICVENEGCDDLEVWKVYQVLPDAKAAGVACIRVIDESGEDYLHPVDRFVPVDFPKDTRARLP